MGVRRERMASQLQNLSNGVATRRLVHAVAIRPLNDAADILRLRLRRVKIFIHPGTFWKLRKQVKLMMPEMQRTHVKSSTKKLTWVRSITSPDALTLQAPLVMCVTVAILHRMYNSSSSAVPAGALRTTNSSRSRRG